MKSRQGDLPCIKMIMVARWESSYSGLICIKYFIYENILLENKNCFSFYAKSFTCINFRKLQDKKLLQRQIFVDRSKISRKTCQNERGRIQLFETMEIPPKKKILKQQPSNTFKMAYLVIKSFKWLTDPSSHILDLRFIYENMHFIG